MHFSEKITEIRGDFVRKINLFSRKPETRQQSLLTHLARTGAFLDQILFEISLTLRRVLNIIIIFHVRPRSK